MNREHLEKWVVDHLNELTKDQLEAVANYMESAIYANLYKDYI